MRILVQEKNNLSGKNGEEETTSNTENKCQPKTELEKSTSEIPKQKKNNRKLQKLSKITLTKKNVSKITSTHKRMSKIILTQNRKGVVEEAVQKPTRTERKLLQRGNQRSIDVANVVDDGAEKMSDVERRF